MAKLRARNSRFSMRALAQKIGVSPTQLSLVMRGQRGLAPEALAKLAKFLKLSEEERAYLLAQAAHPRALSVRSDVSESDGMISSMIFADRGENWCEQAFLRLSEHPKASLLGLAPFVSDMRPDWSRFGADDAGAHTWILPDFTVPGEDGTTFSKRYDPRSRFYQSLMGLITISTTPDGATEAIARHFVKLLILALRAWLDVSRAPAPLTRLVADDVTITPWEEDTTQLQFRVDTCSDIGCEDVFLPFAPAYARIASQVQPFHPVRLHAVALMKHDPKTRVGVVSYACAAEVNGRIPSARHMMQLTALSDALIPKALQPVQRFREAPFVPR